QALHPLGRYALRPGGETGGELCGPARRAGAGRQDAVRIRAMPVAARGDALGRLYRATAAAENGDLNAFRDRESVSIADIVAAELAEGAHLPALDEGFTCVAL